MQGREIHTSVLHFTPILYTIGLIINNLQSMRHGELIFVCISGNHKTDTGQRTTVCIILLCLVKNLNDPFSSQVSESFSMLKIFLPTSLSEFVSMYLGKALEKTAAKSSGFGSPASFFTSNQIDELCKCSRFLTLLNTFIKWLSLTKKLSQRGKGKPKCRPTAYCD